MPSNMPDARAVNEALRRAREMQSRSAPHREPPPPPAPEPKPEPGPKRDEPQQNRQPPAKPASPLDFLMQDKERTLILALLILLYGEGNNTELLFALMYLLI